MKSVLQSILVILLSATVASCFVQSLAVSAHIFYLNWHYCVFAFLFTAPLIFWVDEKLDKIHGQSPQSRWKILSIYVGSCLSHLSGLSVGREGAAIELGKKIGQSFRNLSNGTALGISAAFSALFLHPCAGLLFVFEYHFKFKISRDPKFLIGMTLASVCGSMIGNALGTPHWHPEELSESLPKLSELSIHFYLACGLVILGGLLLFLLEAAIGKSVHFVHRRLRLWLTGFLTSGLTFYFGSTQFNSLSLDLLQTSLWGQAHFSHWGIKTLFSIIALTGTWPGGFFVPLMVMGSTFASSVSQSLGLPTAELFMVTAIGCFAWITPRFGTPLTCTLLTYQLFGLQIGGLSLLVHGVIYFLSKAFKKRPV